MEITPILASHPGFTREDERAEGKSILEITHRGGAMARQRRNMIAVAFDRAPSDIQWYFRQLPRLVLKLPAGMPLEVSVGYLFPLVERAHNMALYCGVVKKHRVCAELASRAIQTGHFTRDSFQQLFENVFGKQIDRNVAVLLSNAEEIRDRVIHGRNVTDARMRQAIIMIIEYATRLNDLVEETAGFRPFGKLRGFKGRARALEAETSRWILKGMGFPLR